MATYDRLNYTQKVVQGDTWTFEYQIKQVVDGVPVPVDITSWTFEGWVSTTRSSTNETDMTVSVIDAVNGRVKFTLSNTTTQSLTLGSLYYQIRYTVAGSVTTLFRGPFMVI